MVSPAALKRFKEIYKFEYGMDLDDQTAMELAEKVLTMFRAIYKPMKLVRKRKEENGKQTNVK